MCGDGKYLILKMGHLKFKFSAPLMITTKRMSRPGDGLFASPPGGGELPSKELFEVQRYLAERLVHHPQLDDVVR